MYLGTVLIDYLSLDYELTSYLVVDRNNERDQIVVDRLRDIDRSYKADNSLDIGGIRIYESEAIEIKTASSRICHYDERNDGAMRFRFKHEYLRIGDGNRGEGGLYYLICPPLMKLSELTIGRENGSFVYGRSHDYFYEPNLKWDNKCSSQVFEMMMKTEQSSTFSFSVVGMLRSSDSNNGFLECDECSDAIAAAITKWPIDDAGSSKIMEDLARVNNYVELKPNVAGIGINFNSILEDLSRRFSSRKKGRRK